jgi:hypothetical protein
MIQKTKEKIKQFNMNEDIHIVIGMIGYIGYNILLNWMYIREYIKDKDKGVIRRGNEWPD